MNVQKQITYIERRNSLFWRVIASLLFTCVVGLLIFFFWTMDFSLEKRHFYAHFDILSAIFVLTFVAIYASYTINCYFDFENKRFKREFTIGAFKYGKWIDLPEISYISLFLKGGFQVNLCATNNKHWDLYEEFNFKDAFTIAFELSELLNVDLLDATDPYNSRWIDKEATKTAKEIIYED